MIFKYRHDLKAKQDNIISVGSDTYCSTEKKPSTQGLQTGSLLLNISLSYQQATFCNNF